MADEKRPRRKSAVVRPDYRTFLAGGTPPAETLLEQSESEATTPTAEPEQQAQPPVDITVTRKTPEPRKATRVIDPEPSYERQRFRTTIFLSPELEELVDRMKLAAKRKGRRETLQFYVEEGIRLLARERGISSD